MEAKLHVTLLDAVLFQLWLIVLYLVLRYAPDSPDLVAFIRFHWRRAFSKHPPLLKLPPDCLLLIRDELSSSPDSIITLALTCKTLFRLFTDDIVRYRGRHGPNLLTLLEKDLDDRLFHCPPCNRLHIFSSTWSPMDREYYPCDHGQAFDPNRSCHYSLRFRQAYLVMNRHMHGPPRGLALENLTKTSCMRSWRHSLMWKNESSAKIIGTQLFLRVVHTVEGKASDVRDAIEKGRHSVCMHVTTDSVDLTNGFDRCWETDHTVAALRDPQPNERRCGLATLLGQPTLFFRECEDVRGSCPVCLTDYTTTIEWAKVTETYWETRNRASYVKPSFDGLRVAITAYHQLGSCRNTDDWRWRALIEMYFTDARDIECRSSNLRNLLRYPPGIVRRAWKKQE